MWLHPVLKTISVLDVLMKEFRTGVQGLFNKAFPSLTGKQNLKSLSQKCNGQISPCSDVCEELVWEELRSHPGLGAFQLQRVILTFEKCYLCPAWSRVVFMDRIPAAFVNECFWI